MLISQLHPWLRQATLAIPPIILIRVHGSVHPTINPLQPFQVDPPARFIEFMAHIFTSHDLSWSPHLRAPFPPNLEASPCPSRHHHEAQDHQKQLRQCGRALGQARQIGEDRAAARGLAAALVQLLALTLGDPTSLREWKRDGSWGNHRFYVGWVKLALRSHPSALNPASSPAQAAGGLGKQNPKHQRHQLVLTEASWMGNAWMVLGTLHFLAGRAHLYI